MEKESVTNFESVLSISTDNLGPHMKSLVLKEPKSDKYKLFQNRPNYIFYSVELSLVLKVLDTQFIPNSHFHLPKNDGNVVHFYAKLFLALKLCYKFIITPIQLVINKVFKQLRLMISNMTAFIFLSLGFILLIKGADFLVEAASSMARKFNVSDLVIGLTVVAFGTSTPELLVNIMSSMKGNTDIAVGNVLGSNIANVFFILGGLGNNLSAYGFQKYGMEGNPL